MPELPDISLYVTRLSDRLVGEAVEGIRFFSPFILRSVGVSPAEFEGKKIERVFRLGKRIVIGVEGDLYILIHLMIAGRFQWQSPAPPPKAALGKVMLASFRFTSGQLSLVEASKKKRAAVYLILGEAGLDEHRREGLDLSSATSTQFAERLTEENRTLKRALTDPHKFDGIGNAYSDEILFHARLSPVRRTHSLTDLEIARIFEVAKATLLNWTRRLETLYPDFPRPSDITAFRKDFAVHGRYGKPCPVCGSPVQHIVYAENETNYCAVCQNEGRLLADRSLSRLLKEDWPDTLEELLEGRQQ